jgi:hypothetical protein
MRFKIDVFVLEAQTAAELTRLHNLEGAGGVIIFLMGMATVTCELRRRVLAAL